MKIIKSITTISIIACFGLIVACGGGGGDTPPANNNPDSDNPTNPPATGDDNPDTDPPPTGGTGTPDVLKSTVKPSNTLIDQNNGTTTTITVQLKDIQNKNITGGGENVSLSLVPASGGSLTAVTDNGNGTYTAILTANKDISALAVKATLNNLALRNTARVGVKISSNTPISALASLGEKIFNDTNLSTPIGQSCATCHDIESGRFDDKRDSNITSEGADPLDFGGRNSLTVGYVAHTPDRTSGPGIKLFGGQFWDGRADDLEEQARQPFLDAVEMGNPNKATVINKIKAADYEDEFKAVFGANSLNNVETAFVQISEAIAAFERGPVFSKFTSKWDAVQAGTATFTASERRGEALFEVGGCNDCHFTPERLQGAQMFTNFEYENIGVPSNSSNPLVLEAIRNSKTFKDFGVGSAPEDIAQGAHSVNPPVFGKGLFKVPTLRNITKTAPYMHNGAFSTLDQVLDFYNTTLDFNSVLNVTADPEVPDTVFTQYVGLFLDTQPNMDDIKAFLETLSDGFTP